MGAVRSGLALHLRAVSIGIVHWGCGAQDGLVVDRASIRVLRDEFIAAYSVVLNNPNPLPKLLAPYKKPAKNSGKSSNH